MDGDYVVPDTAAGAWTNCECGWCRELRLRDDDRITHTARDVVHAYRDGWVEGWMRGMKHDGYDPEHLHAWRREAMGDEDA